jgi:pimeloyl-ACP methyl ester carboxylesterase
MPAKDGVYDIKINAIVSRGGRTDLINDTNILKHMNIPSLFIVGSKDEKIIKINKKTMSEFNPLTKSKMEIIDGASHLFEEEGKIEEVADTAGNWFLNNL